MSYRETTVGEARAVGVAGLEGYPDDMKVVASMPDEPAQETETSQFAFSVAVEQVQASIDSEPVEVQE